jgi:hypothetical protein
MAISRVNVPVVSTLNASAITAASANVIYEGRTTFSPAIYQITCASGVNTSFEFYSNANTLVTSGVTASGTVSINLASTADRIRLWTNTGTDTVVTITRTAAGLTNLFSGTLDTITTLGTSTYTGTSTSGFAYVIAVGGGGGGGASNGGGGQNGGSGGGGGGAASGLFALTGSMSVTVGAGGTGGVSANGAAGGTTTFAGMTANGGAGGIRGASGFFGSPTPVAGGTATGGRFNDTGIDGSKGGGQPAASRYPFITTSIGGGGGWGPLETNTPGGNGTGYGGGGGGGAYGSPGISNGGNGSQGVVYVLRF